ncbi:hypothetical protein ACWGJ6_02370 [Streptomyces canus]
MTTQQPPLTADSDVIKTWLSHVYADAPGLISVCSDADKWAGRRFATDEKGLAQATDYAVSLDKRHPKGIYTQVTTLREQPAKGRGGEDLAHAITHLWADGDFGTIGHKPGLDDLPAPPDEDGVAKVVTESGLPEPSGWVHSGGGYNPVWLLTQTIIITNDQRARLKALTMTWQAILAAQAYRLGWSWDTEVGNLDRLMKLPGSVNRKEGLERPTGIGPGSGTQYDLAQLEEVAHSIGGTAHDLLAAAAMEKQERRNQRLGIKPPPPRPRRAPRTVTPSGDGPLDVLADHLEFGDILEPEGWTYLGTHSDNRQMWRRPAAGGESSSPYSLLCDDHVAVNFSDRSDLPVGGQSSGQKLTIPYLWAHYNYGGDLSAAASDILRAASGRDAHGPAGSLAAHILDDVKRRCGITEQPARPVREDIAWDDLTEPPEPEDPENEEDKEPEDRLPSTFWNATQTLQQIRQAAQARRTSPDAVMHAVMARVAAMADPSVRVDSGIHQPATLCWYCGLFGPSGSGKGNAENTAEELAPFPEFDLAHIDISTGQGLISAYLELEVDPTDDSGKKKVLVQKKTRGYALATEGSVLDAMAQMSAGGTLNGVLCKAWMSERQGTSNAEIERRRSLPKGSYTLSMSLGVQEEPAAKLLEMGSIGLPQRLAWAHATLGPDTPRTRPSMTEQITVTLGDGTDRPVTYWVAGLRNTVITVPEHVTQALDELVLTISFGRGQEAPLDTHEPLWRAKCAALLALLHGRTAVAAEDWERAAVMWRTSQRVRDGVQETARRRLRAEMDARRAEAVQTAVESQSAVYEAMHGVHPSVVNVAKRAHRYLTSREGEIPARDVNRACVAKKDRDKFRESGATESLWAAALKYGCEHGWLVLLAEGSLLSAGATAPG